MPGREQTDVALGDAAPIFEVMRTMRAMRRLAPDPVPDELLDRLVEAALWAPSGGNAQSLEFVVVTDRSQMERLSVPWRRCVDAYAGSIGARGPSSMEPGAYERLRGAVEYQYEHFHETPALFVACHPARRDGVGPKEIAAMMRRLGPEGAARLVVSAPRVRAVSESGSVFPAVQNLLLAARALGLGANLTTWHLFLEHEFKAVLGIPSSVDTYALVPVGWPLGRFGPVRRRPASEVIHRDRW